MKRRVIYPVVALLLISISSACTKEEGEGGNSSIFGKVYVKDYNAAFTVLLDEYYAQQEEVYIIYGEDITYGERVRTNYDGTYEFKYLRPGNYKVYAYSKDSTLQTQADIAIVREVEITGKKQSVEVPLITIFK